MSPEFYRWWKYKNHWSWSVEEELLPDTEVPIVVFRLMYKPETETSWLTIRKKVLKKEYDEYKEEITNMVSRQLIGEYVKEFSEKLDAHPDAFYGLYTMGFFEDD